MKKFILGLILSFYLISPSIAYPSVAAMQALQLEIGTKAQIREIPSCFRMFLAKHVDGEVWMYKVYKSKPNGRWYIEKIRMFKGGRE